MSKVDYFIIYYKRKEFSEKPIQFAEVVKAEEVEEKIKEIKKDPLVAIVKKETLLPDMVLRKKKK